MPVFLAPMLLLYDFAADPAMKTRAQMMCDLLLADFAVEHLRGELRWRTQPRLSGRHHQSADRTDHSCVVALLRRTGTETWEDPEYAAARPRLVGTCLRGAERVPSARDDRAYGHGPVGPLCPPGTETRAQRDPLWRRTQPACVQVHVHDRRLCAGITPWWDPAAVPAAYVGL